MPRVESIIDAFGLRDCQDTRVGNEFIKGLTGGQKKRCVRSSCAPRAGGIRAVCPGHRRARGGSSVCAWPCR
eukprot:COSAG01_NODE_49743_length_369_cov_1.100000_1_plen_71_part_10